ncbi:MAG: protocatechuate 3,4-dioxygenase subunit beta, partial [Burkholderiales bacterium]
MALIEIYKRAASGTQPDYLYAPYASTQKRSPSKPLIILPHTLSEVTGPVFGHDRVGNNDHNLLIQHDGAPIGERITVSGRV